jgi:hypothetical protein
MKGHHCFERERETEERNEIFEKITILLFEETRYICIRKRITRKRISFEVQRRKYQE